MIVLNGKRSLSFSAGTFNNWNGKFFIKFVDFLFNPPETFFQFHSRYQILRTFRRFSMSYYSVPPQPQKNIQNILNILNVDVDIEEPTFNCNIFLLLATACGD